MKDLLIVAPFYNEEENLQYVIDDLRKYMKENMDLLLIDDGSIDASYQIVQENKLKCLKNKSNEGVFKAIISGVQYAYDKEYQYVLVFDTDRQHKAKEIEKMYNTIKHNDVDIVVGSRYYSIQEKSENQRNNQNKIRINKDLKKSFIAEYGRKICQKIIQKHFNQEIRDITSGFRCYNRKAMKKILDINGDIQGLDVSFLLKMLKENLKIKEIPVEMEKRKYGKSMYRGIKNKIYYVETTYREVKKVLKEI